MGINGIKKLIFLVGPSSTFTSACPAQGNNSTNSYENMCKLAVYSNKKLKIEIRINT